MLRCLLLILTIPMFIGCSTLKQEIGDLVKDSVIQSVETKLDEKLSARGLSIKEIKDVIDENEDGRLAPGELTSTVKNLAIDYFSAEGHKLLANTASKNDLDNNSNSILKTVLLALGSLVSAYLGKQVVSAKNDGNRDARIAILEKLLNKDINGDGKVGG